MAARMLHVEKVDDDCGCHGSTDDCACLGYSECKQTLTAIPLKSTRRYCFDFSKADCESCVSCDDRFYEKIRLTSLKKSNPPCVVDGDGFIQVSQEHLDPETGIFRFSVDSNDQNLNTGERFIIEVWCRLPNTEERSISAYIGIK